MKQLAVCVIIPTKNRPDDLERAVGSLLTQTVVPQSLVVIDQSVGSEGRRRVEAELASAKRLGRNTFRLTYIHDSHISGGAVARNRGMELADGDVWLFLDDDVVLEEEFVQELLKVYQAYPKADGVSGVMTNYPRAPLAFRVWSAIFVHGRFRDRRQPIYWNAERLRNSSPLPVDRFTGCVMSFRANAVGGTTFDNNLYGVSEGEDIDFCLRLGHPATLLMAPRARLEHRHSQIGRLQDHWLRRYVRGNLFIYYKHWNTNAFNRLCHAWLQIGLGSVALIACVRRLSIDPWHALTTGIAEARQASFGNGKDLAQNPDDTFSTAQSAAGTTRAES